MRNYLWHVTLLMLSCSSATSAGDWSQFLGEHRNGISAETGLIDRFAQGQPKISWRVSLGTGMSGVAVQGEMVCTLFQDDSQQYVVALDKKSGKQLWKEAVAPAYQNAMGNGPRSTPAVSQGAVYALTGEGLITCCRLSDGRKVWQVDPFQMWGGRPAEYGMACSPVLTDQHVIVTVGAEKATVVALNRETGEVAWTAGEKLPAGYSSPALLKVKNSVQLVVFYGSGAFGVNPHDGQVIWNFPYVTDYDCNIATPLSIAGNILLSAGENHGTVLLDVPIAPGGKVTQLWTTFGNRSVFRNEWQTSALVGGYLYGFDNVGSAGPVTNLSCLDPVTGELVWQKKRFGKGNLIAADGKLWCTTMDGELVIVKATPEKFVELDRATLFGQTRQAPALSDGKLFMRDNAELICVDVKQ